MNPNPLKIAYGSPQLLLKMGDLEISCFILNDNKHVFPIHGIQKLLGYEGKSETWLINTLNAIAKLTKISKELLKAYENPITVEINTSRTPDESIAIVDSFVFLETCKIFVDAKNNGLLGMNLIKISKIAAKVLQQNSNQNIDTLIDVATGFANFKELTKLSIEKYMLTQLEDDSALWLKTISDEFFDKLFEIHNLDWKTMNVNPEFIGKILYDVLFSRVSIELLSELRTNPPKRTYKRKNGQLQNNEHPELKKHLGHIIALLKTSGDNWYIFLQLLNRSFPLNHHYSHTLRFESSSSKNESLSTFNNILKKLT